MLPADELQSEIAPNPLFAREKRQDLCGLWQFAHDDADQGLAAGWWRGETELPRQILVPYPPESKASGLSETGFHPVLWYRREISVPALAAGERLVLHFGAVDYRAKVWVNGYQVAEHEGGHTPFSADITDALQGGSAVIVLRAEDPPEDPRIPRGKQDWREKAHVIWYNRTSGIWQPVWTEVVPALHLTQAAFTPDLPNARVRLELRLNQRPNSARRLTVRLSAPGLALEQSMLIEDSEATLDISVPQLNHGTDRGQFLWTPERPVLIDAEITLDGPVPDRIQSYVGLRSVQATEGKFLLNDRPYFLRMVLGQNYWPDSHLAASNHELRREVELIKAMGFNGVRIHQKLEDPRFLYWCDRLGLAAWGEMPSAYAFSNSAVERQSREWAEAIRRDKGHPAILAWVPLNESWGVTDIVRRPDQQAYARALYHLTKALDPSRPVISNDGWEMVETDILSIHDYSPEGSDLTTYFSDAAAISAQLSGYGTPGRKMMIAPAEAAGRPVMLTEFGGISFTPEAGDDWHGYATVPDAAALEARLEGLFSAITASRHLMGFCYTQATDTMQEVNGLLTEDRQPKLPFEVIHRIVTATSAAVPQEKIDAERRRADAKARALSAGTLGPVEAEI